MKLQASQLTASEHLVNATLHVSGIGREKVAVPVVVAYRAISSRVNRGLLASRITPDSATVDIAQYCAVIVKRLTQLVEGQAETLAEFTLPADGTPTAEALDFFQSIDLENLTAIFEAVQADLTPNTSPPEASPAG